MITTCPNSNVRYIDHLLEIPDGLSYIERAEKLENDVINIPYTDKVTGIAYINKIVFDCNTNDSSSIGIPWKYKVFLGDFNSNPTSLIDIAASMANLCTMPVPPVDEEIDNCLTFVVDLCPLPFIDAGIALLCEFSPANYVFYIAPMSHKIVFKNRYCVMCMHGWNVITYPYTGIEQHDSSCVILYNYDSNVTPVTLSLNGSRMIMDLYSTDNHKSKESHLQCSKLFSLSESEGYTSEIGEDFICESKCLQGMELRHGVCKMDTRLRFAVSDEGIRVPHIDTGAIQNMWKCFLQHWLHTDFGNRTSYYIVLGEEGEAIHVCDIQMYVKDKEEFDTLMNSAYMMSGVKFLTVQLKRHRREYSSKLNTSGEKTLYCFDYYYYSSGSESQSKTLPPCYEDDMGGFSEDLFTTNIDKCLTELKTTVATFSGSSSVTSFASLLVVMAVWILSQKIGLHG